MTDFRERPDFTSANYWNKRFKEEETFDWLLKYHQISHIVEKYAKKNDRILMLGCGNSNLSLEMYQDGYHNIINVDFSSVCIEKMEEKHGHCPRMKWMVMDIKHLTFPDCSFDVVLDKGTLDALVANEKDPWNISDDGYEAVEQSLAQVSRVLKTSGIFISITFSQPHFRSPLLARTIFHWDVEMTTLGNHFHFFFFAMEKDKEMSAKNKDIEREALLKKQSTAERKNEPEQYLEDEETEESFFSALQL